VAETQAQETLSETVSREAHQRMTDERNSLKEQNATLANTLKDLTYVDKARKHFAEKGVDDPDWAADIALPSMRSSATEFDAIGTYLDEKFAKLYPTVAPEGEAKGERVPTPDASEPPGFARPSPASEGAPPGSKKYTSSDPEIQALFQANDTAGLRELVDSGQLILRGSAPVTPG